MGACREGTQQEILMSGIVQSVRNLDKLTWSWFDKVPTHGKALIEDAESLSAEVQRYIAEIKKQMSVKGIIEENTGKPPEE